MKLADLTKKQPKGFQPGALIEVDPLAGFIPKVDLHGNRNITPEETTVVSAPVVILDENDPARFVPLALWVKQFDKSVPMARAHIKNGKLQLARWNKDKRQYEIPLNCDYPDVQHYGRPKLKNFELIGLVTMLARAKYPALIKTILKPDRCMIALTDYLKLPDHSRHHYQTAKRYIEVFDLFPGKFKYRTNWWVPVKSKWPTTADVQLAKKEIFRKTAEALKE